MANLVEEFIKYLQYERKFSSHTVSAYKSDLLQFQDFLSDGCSCNAAENATADMARDWVASLREGGEKPSSVNRKISALRSFSRYCKRNGIKTKVADKLSNLKADKPLPVFFREEDMENILDSPDQQNTDCNFSQTRDNLVLELLYQTGMRRSELISLKDSDFNFFSLTLRIWGKGGKERIVPIGSYLKSKVEDYIKIRDAAFGKTETLIVTDKGEPAYPNLVYRIVKSKMGEAGVQGKRSPHVVRHTFATDMLNGGADLDAVKELLGHANLGATQVYTHTSFERIKQVYKQAHPRK